MRLRVETLVLGENVPAGMDLGVLGGLVAYMRKTSEDPAPILVTPLGTEGLWRVTDGRHRFMAAVVAGRMDVLAIEDPTV